MLRVLFIFAISYIISSTLGFQLVGPRFGSFKTCNLMRPLPLRSMKAVRKSALWAINDKEPTLADCGIEISREEEVLALIHADVSPHENYYDSVYPETVEKMRAAKDSAEREKIEANFDRLMHVGYVRQMEAITEIPEFGERSTPMGILMDCAEEAYRSVMRSEGIDVDKPRKVKRRSVGAIPPLDMLVDYTRSLRKNPGVLDVLKNGLLVSPFMWYIFNTKDIWFKIAAMLAGNVVLTYALLLRGRPLSSYRTLRAPELGPSKSAGMRSAMFVSFFSALAGFTVSSAATRLFMSAFPFATRLSTSMAATVLATGLAASFFEVYEPSDRDGWRWEHMLQQQEDRMNSYNTAATPAPVNTLDHDEWIHQAYNFEYDPDVEDEIDEEAEGKIPIERLYRSEDEIYKEQAQEEYDQFVRDRQQARRDEMPMDHLTPQEVGARPGLEWVDPKDVPDWMNKAVDENLFRAPWTRVAHEVRQDECTPPELKVVIGPKFFRDKEPNWLKPFWVADDGVGVSLEEKRKYGVYRRYMQSLDDGIELRPRDFIEYPDIDVEQMKLDMAREKEKYKRHI